MKTSGSTDIIYEFGKLYTERTYTVYSPSETRSFDNIQDAMRFARSKSKCRNHANIICRTTIIEHICDV